MIKTLFFMISTTVSKSGYGEIISIFNEIIEKCSIMNGNISCLELEQPHQYTHIPSYLTASPTPKP